MFNPAADRTAATIHCPHYGLTSAGTMLPAPVSHLSFESSREAFSVRRKRDAGGFEEGAVGLNL